ncbi:hypothetical protein AB5N19_12574 [Seiridium cardinale]
MVFLELPQSGVQNWRYQKNTTGVSDNQGIVDEDSVDDVLREAGADLSLFDNAERMDDTMKLKFFAEEFGKMQREGRSQSEDRSQIDRA